MNPSDCTTTYAALSAPVPEAHSDEAYVQVLVQQLKDMHAADASNKALIFTQFNESLKYTVDKLEAQGFKCRTISGKV
jgi:superfamily II DNA/RNA helicase